MNNEAEIISDYNNAVLLLSSIPRHIDKHNNMFFYNSLRYPIWKLIITPHSFYAHWLQLGQHVKRVSVERLICAQ